MKLAICIAFGCRVESDIVVRAIDIFGVFHRGHGSEIRGATLRCGRSKRLDGKSHVENEANAKIGTIGHHHNRSRNMLSAQVVIKCGIDPFEFDVG